MKKQLPTNAIANELSGASVFFQKPVATPEPETPPPHSNAVAPQSVDKQQNDKTDRATSVTQPQKQVAEIKSSTNQTDVVTASNHATMPPRNQESSVASHQEAGHAVPHAPMLPVLLETIRKTVRQVGKEAATYRLTEEEKQHLADIVYTYKRRGYRTSDNELARIAINWLILDYQEEGEQSVLARVLEALHR